MSATMALLTLLALAACSSDDLAVGDISAAPDQLTKEVAWDETEASITFAANADWTATVEEVATRAATSISWLKLTVPKGEAGDVTMPLLMTKNDNDTYREAIVTLHCGEKTVKITIHQNANPDAVHVMDPAKIANYDKFYCPGNWNEGFEKGPDYMLRSDARWSWWRMKQSEHFFVFWEPGFGDNPNADSVPKNLRVDVDDLLQKAEQFYKTNVEKLGMATVGQGKSVLDHYKMEIYLLYQTEWLATGSGYDDKIGALWVNPNTCKPVGSTIGHEIGHSFQYQVSADKIFNGEGEKTDYGANVGFRYGYGENGQGGCPYWEQCAQWQSFQDYPQEAFTQDANVQVWLKTIIVASCMSGSAMPAIGSNTISRRSMALRLMLASGGKASSPKIRCRLICASIAATVSTISIKTCSTMPSVALTTTSTPYINTRLGLPSTTGRNLSRQAVALLIRLLMRIVRVRQVLILSNSTCRQPVRR